MDEQVENLNKNLCVKLTDYPDHLEVFPAHGQGTLCGRGMSAKKSSTLGYERRANPMLRFESFEAFKIEKSGTRRIPLARITARLRQQARASNRCGEHTAIKPVPDSAAVKKRFRRQPSTY